MPSVGARLVGSMILCPNDAYEVLHKIGSGGEGQVYCVRSRRYNKVFAAKVLRDHESVEVDILRGLAHQGVISVYNEFHFEGRHVIIFEYCEGGDLTLLIRDWPGGIPADMFLNLAGQMVDAMCYVHAYGVAHGDLKPQNVLFRDVERTVVVVADFGLASYRQATVTTGCGSLEWLAPECLRPGLIDPMPADVWSLGMIWLYVLKGSTFPGDWDRPRVMRAILQREIDPDVGNPELTRILSAMLEADPSMRPTMATLAGDPHLRRPNPMVRSLGPAVGIALPRVQAVRTDVARGLRWKAVASMFRFVPGGTQPIRRNRSPSERVLPLSMEPGRRPSGD